MKAKWHEDEDCFYFGETSVVDSSTWHGKGIQVIKDGKQLFECWWIDDVIKGKGRWINGETRDMHHGDYVNRNRHGYGVYTWANGNKYEGLWENDEMQGRGVMIFSDGSRREGIFNVGMEDGISIET